jgi:hypothetical protein
MTQVTSPKQFSWSQLIAAGAVFNPLATWDYETPDVDVMVEVLQRATAVGLVGAVKSAGDNILQESPIQAGGTAGTLPSRLNTEAVTGRASAFQKLSVPYRNPTGGGITVDGNVTITPIARMAPRGFGGGRRRRSRK